MWNSLPNARSNFWSSLQRMLSGTSASTKWRWGTTDATLFKKQTISFFGNGGIETRIQKQNIPWVREKDKWSLFTLNNHSLQNSRTSHTLKMFHVLYQNEGCRSSNSGKRDYQGCKRATRNFHRREESFLLEPQALLWRNPTNLQIQRYEQKTN